MFTKREYTEWHGEEREAGTVPEGDACPGCGENRVDWLVWTDDGDHVECATCGAWYDPDEED